jgi:prepilin-type processing-associated H-X9-DG protein
VGLSPGWGWAALLLPFVEQDPLAKQINYALPVEHPSNWPARGTVLKIYTCPSDLSTGPFDVLVDLSTTVLTRAATNSYAACYGDVGPVLVDPGAGMFYCNSQIRVKDITDGTTNTFAVGERAALFTQTPWAGAVSMGSARTMVNAPVYQSVIESAPCMPMARASGRRALNDPTSEPYDFFSPHRQVVNFVFADGSVHALSTATDPTVLLGLATIAGGEVTDGSSY